MKVVEARPRNTEDALEVIDALRQHVIEGRVIAFAIAAVESDDTATAYASATQSVSRLRLQGAIAQLLHNYLSGDLDID